MSHPAIPLVPTQTRAPRLHVCVDAPHRSETTSRSRAFWLRAAVGLVGLGLALNGALLLLSAGWPGSGPVY